jgi:hypothetical protein
LIGLLVAPDEVEGKNSANQDYQTVGAVKEEEQVLA